METITMAQLQEYIMGGRRFKLACSSPTFEYGNTIAVCFNATRAIMSMELKTITFTDDNGNRAALHCIDDIKIRSIDRVNVHLDIICNDLERLYRYRLSICRD